MSIFPSVKAKEFIKVIEQFRQTLSQVQIRV